MAGSNVRIEQRKPSREIAPHYENLSQPVPFQGSGGGPAPPIVPPGAGAVSIMLRPNVGDEILNVAGASASQVEAATLNAQFAGKITSFPGGAGDWNQEQWVNLAVPANLAAVPNLRARVHLIVLS